MRILGSGGEMSSPVSEPTFTAPQANLALYGALDDILTRAMEEGDAQTAVLVNQYLPGSIEFPGWANELREIFGPAQTDDSSIAGAVSEALNAVMANFATLTIPDW